MKISHKELKPISVNLIAMIKRHVKEINDSNLNENDFFSEGNRNSAFFKLSCKLIEMGIDETTLWKMLKAINTKAISKPLEEQELEQVFNSASSRTNAKGTAKNKPLVIYKLEDLFNDELFEDPIPIVEGLIHKSEFHIFSAPAKLGKTQLGIHLAHSVASGGTFLGRFKCHQGKVLIVQTEVSENQLRKRVIKQIMVLTPELKDQILFTGKRIKIDSKEGMEELEDVIVETKPTLVILDPFYTLHTKNEDSSSEIAPILSDVRELALRNEIAILMIHHQGKSKENNSQTGHKHRGSSSFADAPDGSWSLNNIEGSTSKKLSFEMRNIEAPGPFKCQLSKETLIWRIVGEFEESSAQNLLEYEDLIEHIQSNEGLKASELIEDMIENYAVGKRTVQKIITKAYKQKLIYKKKDGRIVRYYSNEMNAKLNTPKEKQNAHFEK